MSGSEEVGGTNAATEDPGATAPNGTTSPTPKQLWGIGIVAVLWNCMGCFDYLMTQTHNEAYTGSFSPELICKRTWEKMASEPPAIDPCAPSFVRSR